MEQKFCQSCGMPLTDDDKGTNADGSRNDDYCNYCYVDGRFRQDLTMEQMVEHCARFTDDINKWSGENMTVEEAKEMMRQFYATLKRWKNSHGYTTYNQLGQRDEGNHHKQGNGSPCERKRSCRLRYAS